MRPRLQCSLYLAGLGSGILVYPYDDGGMDVVGPNQALLSLLYTRFDPTCWTTTARG